MNKKLKGVFQEDIGRKNKAPAVDWGLDYKSTFQVLVTALGFKPKTF